MARNPVFLWCVFVLQISVTCGLDSPSFAAFSCNDWGKTQATLVLGSCRKQDFFFLIPLCSPDLEGAVCIYLLCHFIVILLCCFYDTTKLPCALHISNQHYLISPPLHCLMTLIFNFDRPRALRSLFHMCNTLVLCSSIESSRGVLGLKLVHFHPVVSVGLLFHSGCPSTVMSQDSRRQINDLVL